MLNVLRTDGLTDAQTWTNAISPFAMRGDKSMMNIKNRKNDCEGKKKEKDMTFAISDNKNSHMYLRFTVSSVHTMFSCKHDVLQDKLCCYNLSVYSLEVEMGVVLLVV